MGARKASFILLLGAGRSPSQGFASVFFLIISCVLNFLNFAWLQSPKLGLSLGTKVKILLHHTAVIDSRCVRVELEDIHQERLDIDVFWLFSFY